MPALTRGDDGYWHAACMRPGARLAAWHATCMPARLAAGRAAARARHVHLGTRLARGQYARLYGYKCGFHTTAIPQPFLVAPDRKCHSHNRRPVNDLTHGLTSPVARDRNCRPVLSWVACRINDLARFGAWHGCCYCRRRESSMTSTERAVRKASRARLLRDFAWAARQIEHYHFGLSNTKAAQVTLAWAGREMSRTRYACLMTAFGQ